MRTLWHSLRLMRAHSAFGAALAVAVGGALAGAALHAGWLAPMTLAFVLAAAGNVDNDLHDIAIDRQNRPIRPLPAGDVSPSAARRLLWALLALGLALAVWLGTIATAGTLSALLLTYWYTRRLKAYPLLGPLLVGGLTAAALGYGGIVAGNLFTIVWPMATVGLFFAGREIVKTMYDVAGDRTAGARTTAIVFGYAGALRLATVLFGIAAGCALYASLPWLRTRPAAWPAVGIAMILLFGPLVALWRSPADRDACNSFLMTSKVVGLGMLGMILVVTTF